MTDQPFDNQVSTVLRSVVRFGQLTDPASVALGLRRLVALKRQRWAARMPILPPAPSTFPPRLRLAVAAWNRRDLTAVEQSLNDRP